MQNKVKELRKQAGLRQEDLARMLGVSRQTIIAIENNSCTNLEVMPDYQFREGDVMVAIGKIDHLDGFESALRV